MDIRIEEKGLFRQIGLTGRLDGTTMQQLERTFLELVEAGHHVIVFDLTELEYISSAGLRVMLLSLKKTKAAGGKTALFGLNENVKEVFDISGFSQIFSIFNSETEAQQFVSAT